MDPRGNFRRLTQTGAIIQDHQGLKCKSEARKKKNSPTHPSLSCSAFCTIPREFCVVRALDNVSKEQKVSPPFDERNRPPYLSGTFFPNYLASIPAASKSASFYPLLGKRTVKRKVNCVQNNLVFKKKFQFLFAFFVVYRLPSLILVSCCVVKCPAPKKYRCTTSLHPLCDETDSCPDGKICCFDGCRRKCIDLKSAPLAGLYLFYDTDRHQTFSWRKACVTSA